MERRLLPIYESPTTRPELRASTSNDRPLCRKVLWWLAAFHLLMNFFKKFNGGCSRALQMTPEFPFTFTLETCSSLAVATTLSVSK